LGGHNRSNEFTQAKSPNASSAIADWMAGQFSSACQIENTPSRQREKSRGFVGVNEWFEVLRVQFRTPKNRIPWSTKDPAN